MTTKEELKVILDNITKATTDKEMYFWFGRLVQWGRNHLEERNEQK